ncbi:SH3 domain-containing protein [Acuticoccus sp. MNP-M23]|uniref:SH3 domain-containing protein n=1 Tax=Acuticoccus sp. MNP-M23 TaxID=3072793 RepID=UPI00281685B1|nr:SH3 domain-containing protein [Acuticoccus sp. MNP-M23]WMS43896.1 SH3 domain-containing protein [Acuticoccus sp. MNP-M23]
MIDRMMRALARTAVFARRGGIALALTVCLPALAFAEGHFSGKTMVSTAGGGPPALLLDLFDDGSRISGSGMAMADLLIDDGNGFFVSGTLIVGGANLDVQVAVSGAAPDRAPDDEIAAMECDRMYRVLERVEDALLTRVAANDVLNVRVEPFADARKIGELPHDATDIVILRGCRPSIKALAWTEMNRRQRMRTLGRGWCHVGWQGVEGWVSGTYLRPHMQ